MTENHSAAYAGVEVVWWTAWSRSVDWPWIVIDPPGDGPLRPRWVGVQGTLDDAEIVDGARFNRFFTARPNYLGLTDFHYEHEPSNGQVLSKRVIDGPTDYGNQVLFHAGRILSCTTTGWVLVSATRPPVAVRAPIAPEHMPVWPSPLIYAPAAVFTARELVP